MGNFIFENYGGIKGLYHVQPEVRGDARGYFMETYNYNDFKKAGLDMVFVQDNQSLSTKGVLRGLHFQKEHTQGKLVRVISGEVFDVAVCEFCIFCAIYIGIDAAINPINTVLKAKVATSDIEIVETIWLKT